MGGEQPGFRPTTEAMRHVLFLATSFLALAGVLLSSFPASTDAYFPFYIDDATTAGFIGANYVASACLDLLCRRERIWANARIAVPGAMVFSTLTGVVTGAKLEYFDFDWPVTVATIFWLIVYWGFPVIGAVVWFHQVRTPGGDPPIMSPMPSWVRAFLLVTGIGALLFGTLVAAGVELWPWNLMTATRYWSHDVSLAPYVGAWVVSYGVLLLHARREADFFRLRPMAIASIVLGVLQLGVIARNPPMRLAEPPGLAYLGALLSVVCLGVAALVASRSAPRAPRGEVPSR